MTIDYLKTKGKHNMPITEGTNPERLLDHLFRTCESKVGYPSFLDALKVITWLDKREQEKPDAQAYKCEYCGMWHIGHRSIL
jgi:hypothetical protein